ncbi:phage holin family protein [Pantoea sp. AS142]|uniref:phage holin family protein n=1 Tax=Pantoea sp. AS142 TaxID=3081292 RepID=UPI003016AB25
MTFRCVKVQHNRLIRYVVWLLAVASGAVTIRLLTSELFYIDWTEVLINLLPRTAISALFFDPNDEV